MPAQTTHHVGGTKHFECKVKGHPRPEIRWYKDNKEITHLPRYKFDHSQEGVISMVIPDITLYDEGHYRCRAENSEGFASTSAYLFVRVHKEHLEEASTSFHTMQIEESVLFTESEKAVRTSTKTKASEPFFETSIEEISGDCFRKSRGGDYSRETDINGDYSKGKELSLDKNGVSEDNLKENGSRKDNLKEKNSLTTRTHLQEDVYRKSVENVVKTSTSTTTITSRSKQEIEIAEQESNKIKADMLEKSYHSSDDSNDEVDAVKLSRVSEKSEVSGNESHQENFDEDRSSLLMRQTRRLFSHDFGEESDLLQKASSTTLDTTATTTKTTSVTTTEMSTKTKSMKVEMSTSSVKSSSEETRQETVKSGKLETSKSVSTSAAAASHTTAIERNEVASQLATPSETKLEALESGVTVSTTSTSISQKAGKSVVKVEETSSGSVSSRNVEQSETVMSAEETTSNKLGKGESDTGRSSSIQDSKGLLSSQIPAIKMDTSNNVQAEATQKVTSDLQSKEAIQRRADGDDKGRNANGREENPANLNNEKLLGVGGTAETEKQKTFARKEEEFESGSESDGDSSVESVVDVDLDVVNTQKLRKQESKEKDEAVEESKLYASKKAARSETDKEDINRKDDVDKDDIGNKRKGFHDNEQKHKEAEAKDAGGEGETKTKIGEKEKKDKCNDEVEDDTAKKRRRRNENSEDNKKDVGVSEGDLQGQRQGDDDEEERRTNEAEQQRMSWISKVEEEKDKEKSKNDNTAKEGDKEAVSPRSEPRIVQKMEDVKVNSGKTLKLRTQVQGSPRPNVTWLKEDRPIQQGGRVTIFSEDDVYSLEIEEVSDGDAGTYRFRAVNSEGEVFTDVVVSVVSAVPSSLAPGDRQLSLSATVGIPEFLVRPQDISVAESETIKLTCTVTGDPAPKITWQKDGKVLRSNRHVRVYEARGVYNLEIYDCEATDAGGYVCTATNSRGETTATFNVFIEGVESVMSVSGSAETDDLAAGPGEDALLGATGGAVESSSDELFLQSYVVLMDYVDEDTKIRFSGGDLVEVLDSRQKSGMWLVRGNVEKDKVCFIPSSLLCIAGDANIEDNKKEADSDKEEIKEKKRERKTNHSPKLVGPEVDIDTSEDELRLRGVLPDYVAVADYVPPSGDANSVRLSEGQIVEVVDKERPDLWLVKTRPSKTSPSRQGWVPSAYLEEKTASAQLISRSTRETFREEVLQVSNKQQEASLKRRYVIKELEETEREYIRDLKVLADSFLAPVTQHPHKVPELVTSSSDVIFSNIMDILQFHDSKFLADIAECCIQPSSIGSVFLKWKSEFDNYIQFWGDRDPASFLLESEEIKQFFTELSKKALLSETDIINHLKRPIDRLKMYQLLLRGILRYAARAGEDCSQVQEAIAMLIAIEKAVENSKLLPLLEGFEVASTDVENLLRHDDFIMWEGEGGSSSRKERHVFLFADKIVMTKKKKRQELSADQTYFSFKSSTDLSTVRVRESSSDDDRKFELWFIGDSTLEKVTLQARSATAKQVWVKDIREALIKLGISEPDKMPETIPDQADDDITPSGSGPSSPLLPPKKSPAEEFDFSSQRKDSSKDTAGKTDGSNDVTVTDDNNPSKPFVTDLPTNVACQEGHPTRIECHLEGYPTPEVNWQKGGKPVQEGATIKISLEGKTTCLIFSEVSKSDSGVYSVKVSNSQGSSSSSFDLVVLEDLVETDTSTDRTNGEVEDTASGSETVVEEEEESSRKLKEDEAGKRKKLLIEEKKKEAEEERLVQERKKQENKEAQFVVEADEEVVSKVSVEEKQKERRRQERGEDKTSVSEKADTEEKESEGWDLVVESEGQVQSSEQTSSFSSETSTSRSVLQGKEGEDWAVEVSSQVKETTSHQRSEFLSVTSETFVDGSLVSGTEVTQSSLSFTTDISSSENTPTLSALTAAQQPQSESLSLQSEASVESSTFRQTESAQNSLSFQTGISNSESIETDFGLITPDQSHSKGLSLESDTSIDSSSYKHSEVTQNLLSFQTDLQNSENVEAVLDITSPERNDEQKAEFSTQPKTEDTKAEVEQIPEAEVSEKEIIAEVKQISKLQEQQATKPVEASEGFTASTVAEPEQEEQIAFEESFQKEKAEPRNESQDFKLTESTENLKQKQELQANFEEDVSVSKPDTDLKEGPSHKKALESPENASHNQVLKPLEAATDIRDSQAVPDSVSAEKTEKNISPETGKSSGEPKENQVDTSYNKDKSPSEEIVADFQFEEEEEKVSLFGKRFEEQREENKKAKEKKDEVDTSFNKDKPEKANQRDQEGKSESEQLVTDFQFEEEEEKVSLFGKRFEEQREENRKTKEKENNLEKDQDKGVEFTEGKKLQSKEREQEKTKPEKTVLEEAKEEEIKQEKAKAALEEAKAKQEQAKAVLEEEKAKQEQVKAALEEAKEAKAKQEKAKAALEEEKAKQEQVKAALEEAKAAKAKQEKVRAALEEEKAKQEKAKAALEEAKEEKAKADLEEANQEKANQDKLKADLEEAKAKHEKAKTALEEEKAKQEKTKAALEKVQVEKAKAALEEEKAKQEKLKAALEEAKQEKAKAALEEANKEKAKQEKAKAALEEEKAKQEQAKVALEEAKEETRTDKEKDSRASAPRIVAKMDDCVTELGDLARFDCRVSAYPDPEITWFKDGNKVTPSTKYELLNFHDDIFSLLIKKVDLADSGRYTCVAKNEYGEAKSQALLNVMGLKEKITDAHVAPSFVTKFYDMEAIEGVPVEFVCVIDGNPDPIVTWLLNGQEVQNSSEILTRRQEDTVMLAFRSIKVEHSGEVICKLKNDCGQAMCKARLKVKEDLSKRGERPLFLEQPSDKEVTEGEEVTFECVISGRPDPEVTWYFNGRELHDSKRRTMRSKPGQKYTLTIREVVPEYAGVYTCKAVNRAGDASCAVELSVKEIPTDQSLKGKYYDSGLVYDAAKYAFPPSFTRRIQDQRSLPGRSARFEALVIGVPEPQVEWYKDGVPLKWGGKYKMGLEGNNAILVVDNCDLSDEGNYTCTLYNDAGKASSTAQLKVQEDKLRQSLPRFMSPASGIDLYRIPSSPATKKPTLRDIPPEDKIPTIPIDKPVLLDVKPTATKLSWMPAPTAMLPENAQRITYIIEACQLPSKQWVRLESNIDSTTHYVYGLKPDTEYMFRVKAENRFGTSDPTLPCTLKRREEPKTRESMLRESEIPARPVLPKTRPYVSDIGKETVQIGWKPAEIPDYYGRSMSVPPVTYRVEAQKLPSEEWVPLASRVKKPSIYLSDLEPDRDYNIRVRAQTPYGVSQPTEPVWIPRAKAFTGVPVSRPIITEIEEGTARLQWTRVDIPAFNSLDEPLMYMIEMQEPPSSRWRELARRVPINSYIVRDLEPAQDYRFRVRAESRDGLLSEPSPATSLFRTLALSHAPVDRLEVEEYDPDLQSARLSWRRVEVPPYGAGESPLLYMIECETPGLEGWRPLVSGIPTTRYRVPDLSPTEDYRFRVRALSAYGMSPPSYPTTLHRRPSPMRPLAHDLHISSLEPESVGLSWRSASVPPYKSSEPISYQIEALEYPKQEWRPLATNIRDTNYRLGGLKPSSDYSFRVRAHTPSGLAEPTAPVNLSSLQVRPRLPVREPSVTELSLDSARLQWKPAELPYYSRHITPITYTVDYQEVPGRDWVVAARNIPDTSYTFRGLRGDRDYRFRVCPQTEHGPGEYSLPANIHRRAVPSLPTREPMISNVSPTTATLSWHPATLASGSLSRPITYRIESREPPSSAWYEVASRHPSTSYNLQFLYPDQDYMFRVLADYDGVESEPTMAVFLPRRAGPPKMYRDPPFLSNVQPESVILAWRSVELPSRITDYSPVTYRIEVQEGPTSDWRPWARQVNQTHFHVTKLRPDTDYSFRIRAENEFGISEPTDPILIRKRAVAPLMSQHEPLISDVRPESLRLTWQPAEMPSYLTDSVPVTYTVYSQEEGDHSWQPIARRIAGTSYYVTGLSPDRDYSFRIQAENTFGTSLQSFPSRLHRKLKAPIYSPEIEDVDSTSFRLSWKQPALSRPTTYSVETLEPLTWKWRPLVSRLPHPSYRVTGIQPTADYAFRVRAEVDSVISDPSLPISFSRRRALPTVPVERPTLSEVYDDTVRVNWHPSYYKSSSRKLGPQFYRLEVRELPDTNWHTLVSRTDAWSYEVTDLKPNQDYAFRVRTVTDTGMSEPSLPVFHYRQATTPRVPLPLPEVSDIGDDYIGLRWKLVDIPAFDSDETPLSFMIEAQRVPEYDWRPVARGVTGLSHKVTGLEPRHDYMFRLRGETPIGLTQPSATIPVYRKPVLTGVPITNLRIDPDVSQPYSARLHWNPVYIPSFGSNTTFAYTVEVQEPPRSDWYPVARDVYSTSYTVPELSPLKDYLFRIKARLPGGEYSAPTPPIPYYRSPVTAWDRILPPIISPYVPDSAPIARPYIEGLILKVPPRMSIEKPDMTVISQESIQLTWKSARVPSATSSLSPTTYRVEVRQEDSFEWIEKATGIKGLTTEIKGLNPYIDYAFRVRAVNDFGWSESTLPAFLHRPQELRDAAAEMEFEEYEIYGSSLSDISVPRMPMDTPRMGLIQDRALSLSWTPARIPAYARKTPITYIVEKKEPVDHDWVPLVSRISDTSYTIRSIEPKQDYLFRIRAENEHGLSEATLPAVLTRSKAPQFVRSSTSRERELDSSSRRSSYSYIDTISAGVPPRVPSGRPSISDISDTSLILSWQPGRMPSYIKGPVKISYIVEVRQPPNHMWTKVSESVAGASYQVTGLKPDQDYMFRVRAYNDSGISEPTLPVSLNRDRAPVAEPRTHRRRSSVERFSSIERRASIERSMSMDRGSSVPRILSRDSTRRDDEDLLTGKTQEAKLSVPEFVPAGSPGVQYAIDAQPVKLSVQIGGFPLPTVNWYFKGKKLLFGDRYDGYVTPAGVAVLQFGPMTWDDVGEYKCVAENEQGEANFVVRLQISDPPTFLLPIRDLQIEPQGHGQFTCQVDGIPAPTVKFMKDWKPITESSKFKVTQDALDKWSLHIDQATSSVAGCYVCVAENTAGKVFSSARLSVDDDIPAVDDIYYKKTNFEDDYYVLEELGRGRYSTVRRVIQRTTGKEFAAKFTKVRDEADKDFFHLELDALIRQKGRNVQKLHDAYETSQQLILVVNLAEAGDILERATSGDTWTEARAAQLIKLILLALRDVHSSGFVHLDLKPTNVRFSSLDDNSLQLIDFGFARKLPLTSDLTFNYGTPEFCSPESVSNQTVTTASDLWAVGVLAHLLLTGVSPFYAETTSEILSLTRDCKWNSDAAHLSGLTDAARDFISRLLVREPQDRLSLESSLGHDWLKLADKTGLPSLDVSRLRAFQERVNAQQKVAAVRTVANLVSLKRLLEGTVSLRGLQPTTDTQTGEVILPDTEEYGQFLDEESWYEWQARHQQGFKSDAALAKPQVKGHRLSVDILAGDADEELSSSDKTSGKQASGLRQEDIPPSIEKELEWLDEARKQRVPRDIDEISLASKRSSLASISTEGFPGPLFKEKLHDMAFSEGDNVILRCVVAGPPTPTVVWYKNEELLAEGARLKMSLEEDGEATLTIRNAKNYDAAVYKCVGRNKFGRVSNRMRLLQGDVPGRPGQPAVAQVSSTDALILWEAPRSDGNSGILFYRLDHKAAGQDKWLTAVYTTQEAALATGLAHSTFYRFRVSATNRFGTSHYSWASVEISTKPEGTATIASDNFFNVSQLTSSQTSSQPALPTEIDDIIPEGEATKGESEPTIRSTPLESVYNIGDALYKGRFYEEKALTLPSDNDKKFILRTVPFVSELREYEILKSLRHEYILRLYDAYSTTDYIHLVLEYSEGQHIARHLSQRRKYTENTVVSVIRQVLYAIEFLQRYSLVHLNLQPASIVVSKLEGCQVKLTDFSLARKVSGPEGDVFPRSGFADFIPPEVVVRDLAGFPADVWGVGALAFLLLSGVSPFHGDSSATTLVNIALNRYEAADLYENISTEALKFIFKVLKRLPRNRPSVQECLDNKWLQLTDLTVKEREDAIFLSNTLATFVSEYDLARQSEHFRQSFDKDELPVQMSAEKRV